MPLHCVYPDAVKNDADLNRMLQQLSGLSVCIYSLSSFSLLNSGHEQIGNDPASDRELAFHLPKILLTISQYRLALG